MMSIIIIIVLVIVLLVAIGILGLFVGLVSLKIKDPKTRPWGIGLLVVPLGFVLLLMLGLFLWMGTSVDVPGEARSAIAWEGDGVHIESGTAVSLDDREMARDESNSHEESSVPVVDPAKTAEKPPEPQTEPRPSESVVSGKSLGPFNGWRGSDNDKRDNDNKRPDWVDAPSGVVDNAYQCCVTVGPYTTSLECARSSPDALRPVVADYVKLLLGPKVASPRVIEKVIQANIMGLATKDIWEETKETSVGRMTQQHVLLVFDRRINDLIRQKLHESRVEQRIIWSGIALGGTLVLLVIAFIILKVGPTSIGKYHYDILLVVGSMGLAVLYAITLLNTSVPDKDDVAGFITIMAGCGGFALTFSKKTCRFGIALLVALALGSLALLA